MYLDRQTSLEHARAVQNIFDWFGAKARKLFGLAPNERLIFLDTETTGLKPGASAGEVIEVALIIEEPTGAVHYWSTKIKPQHIETASPKALEINGYTSEAWEHAMSPEEAAKALSVLLEGGTLVGHNIPFDIRFLDALLSDFGLDFRASDLPYICTKKMADKSLKPLGMKSVSLVSCCDFFGWDRTDAHTAEADTENCRRLYHKLKDPSQRQVEKWTTLLSR
tara:strand:+ start:8783 stop:9451 length:669 start_codon:yes stop_codon:yes gene_type:complete